MMMAIYFIPFFVAGGIVGSIVASFLFHAQFIADLMLLLVILIGSIDLIKSTIQSLIHKKFALDYIALLSITIALVKGQYFVAAIIVLMLASGTTLEKHAVARAKRSLTKLTDRIPHTVSLWQKGEISKIVAIERVIVGEEIFIRKGEVIPLDGVLVSENGLTDESSLTGEPYVIDKTKGDLIRSGTVNMGEAMVIRVTRPEPEGTYKKILMMVAAAQNEKSPFIRLADRYSTLFTIVTVALAVFTWLLSGDTIRVLAVFVIATPCPLILATPIALIGGVNAFAKQKIIAKQLSAIETLSRVHAIIFDKTGTITLGRPTCTNLAIVDHGYSKAKVLAVASAIERNSLHPIAKAIQVAAKAQTHMIKKATGVVEAIGHGINGTVDGKHYSLTKKSGNGLTIALSEGKKTIALFSFEDEVKIGSPEILKKLRGLGLRLFIFTGDKEESTQKVLAHVELPLTVRANMAPQDKMDGIREIQKGGLVTAMVGDGINDAPALAAADVGLVFSNEEQTAASEAADIVFLGGDFSQVLQSLDISRRTVAIALQSIWVGMGASIVGMILASFGYIPPISGAVLQEIIDIVVIINALRASR